MMHSTLALSSRLLTATIRMPVFALIALVQPVFWLLLFGNLFAPIMIQAQESISYQQVLVPGLTIMAAYFSSAYAGMYILQDSESGMLARQMVAPVARGSIVLAYVLHATVLVLIQSAIVVVAASLFGVGPKDLAQGFVRTLLSATLVGFAFSSLSIGLAVLAGRPEPVLGIMNFIALPMLFISEILTGTSPVNTIMARLTQFNSVNWAVVHARAGYLDNDPSTKNAQLGYLVAFAAFALLLALQAFRRHNSKM
ncbi:hypothetical protein D5041_11630 [Verminephrobacter aporrectodeae subsp. tuberculatae]|uniref:ABC transporter permease n=1 Tax=Verminephrobacter aporrectodeae TaxID=1110389 RepID=UPI002237F65E|nr:ABC transporter permease [Verminephrobacter aporrectodeae]MCW5220381.1 hypothetical protein [Verminephrobacter aporrectodeae subsp. tuberculatae]MCW5289677.1 hypothetical protein [Verminephrobacter aporrectodeae subsp. tuberculatae]